MTLRYRRPALHAACILFALPLRWLTSHEALLLAGAACIFNMLFLPALAPSLYRATEDKSASGIVWYPIAVLLMIAMLPLHVACACWAIMALGDAAASTMGGGAEWPWNPRKTIRGSLAFLIAAYAGGSALWWWISFAPPSWTRMGIAVVAAAIVESLPLPIDDNLTVSLAAALAFWTFAPSVTISPMGAAVSFALAAAALALGLLTISGAIAGFFIATALYSFEGWQAFALLAAFFVLGSGATRLAYRRKQSMGLAEQHKGKRVAAQAVANAGAAVIFAYIGQPLPMAAALAAATADTIATEIGPLFAGSLGGRVFLLATGKAVRPGTSGGISVAGTFAGLAGSAIIAVLAMLLGLTRGTEFAVITLAGATGSAVDSYLGGTLEKEGLLNNEGVNFLGTAVAGLLAWGLYR